MIPYQTSKEIEKAIVFLVHAINTSGNNPKPVILHSILVGLSLAKLDYSIHVIQAGFLHDTIEDSSTGIESIKEQFGDKVASIVAACTYDRSIQDKTEQYRDAMRRAAGAGKEALIVMAADLIQNEPYYNQEDFTQYPWDKIIYFIGFAELILKDESIWEDLELIKQKIYGVNQNNMQSVGEKPKIKKAVGCFLEHEGRFLILQRRPEKHQGGKWGLPAGGAEQEETEKEAVIREVREETGFLIPLEKLEFLKEIIVDYTGRKINFFAYRVKLESKIKIVLEPQEHQAYAWVTGKECYARDDLIRGVREVLKKTGYAYKDVT